MNVAGEAKEGQTAGREEGLLRLAFRARSGFRLLAPAALTPAKRLNFEFDGHDLGPVSPVKSGSVISSVTFPRAYARG